MDLRYLCALDILFRVGRALKRFSKRYSFIELMSETSVIRAQDASDARHDRPFHLN